MRVLLALLMALVLLVQKDAYALSCMKPEINDKEIEKYTLIFDGVVIDEEASIIKNISINNNNSKYIFKIKKLWKGDDYTGNEIEVKAKNAWPNRKPYNIGEDYMVFVSEVDGVYYTSPGWCGPDIISRQEVISAIKNYNSKNNKVD